LYLYRFSHFLVDEEAKISIREPQLYSRGTQSNGGLVKSIVVPMHRIWKRVEHINCLWSITVCLGREGVVGRRASCQ
jgi:hypothetical protein